MGTIEQLVVCQFVDSLLEPMRSQLRALMSRGDWKLQGALECAKSMLWQHGPDYIGSLVGHATTGSANSQQVRPTGQPAVCEWSSRAEGTEIRGKG